MLKREFAFAVSLFAVMSVGNAYATTPSGTEAVSTAHTVYTAASNAGASGAATNIASGIAGVTYVNRMVNLAGNAAQKAEDHAAAAGASAIVAKQAADDAATEAAKVANKFDKKFTADATKKAIVTTDKDGNVLPVKISDTGTGTYITGVSVSDAGAVTLTRGTPASYSLPTASSSTKGGVKIGANVNVATDGTISVNTTATPTKDSAVPLTSGGAYTALAGKQATIGDLETIRSGAAEGATAVQLSEVKTGSANGTISVQNTDVAVKGLGSAAYTASTAYATAAQGVLAANAVPQSLVKSDFATASSADKDSATAIPTTGFAQDMIDATFGDTSSQLNTLNSKFNSLQSSKQDATTAVTHTASTAVGTTGKPVYIASSGAATVVTGIDASLLPTATTSAKGAVKTGPNITNNSGTISVADATATVKGVAMLGVIPAGTDKSGTATIWVE